MSTQVPSGMEMRRNDGRHGQRGPRSKRGQAMKNLVSQCEQFELRFQVIWEATRGLSQ